MGEQTSTTFLSYHRNNGAQIWYGLCAFDSSWRLVFFGRDHITKWNEPRVQSVQVQSHGAKTKAQSQVGMNHFKKLFLCVIKLFKTQTDVSATSDIILHFILGLPKIRGLTLCQEYINLHSYCRCCLADHVVTEGQKCGKTTSWCTLWL